MPVVSSQMHLLEQPLLYTQVGMVSDIEPADAEAQAHQDWSNYE
jgi:hypothetical protein